MLGNQLVRFGTSAGAIVAVSVGKRHGDPCAGSSRVAASGYAS